MTPVFGMQRRKDETMSFKKVAIGTAVIAAAVMASAAQAQEFRLNYGHYLNDSPYLKVEQEFAKAIEERSGGRVAINIVYSGGLGKGEELLPLAGRGAVDMAAIVPGRNLGAYPPFLAAWAPFLLFVLVGEAVLIRTEE